ncbi:MAG: glycosyltransferase family 39 protein [Burkholderiales bacterium]|nr:glycosyltransferase family 39 protein [Burkholderiales bacterium]
MTKINTDNNTVIKYLCLVIVGVLANSIGMFSPVLNSNDAYFYSIMSKNIVTSDNWVWLFYQGQDWLDKPHFPFWMTALSFKVFGISVFAFVLPGFVFSLIGAIYTYRLAKEFFDFETAALSALIYITSLHLMTSAIDIRAEAFLLGQIVPACFYLWRFNTTSRFKHLVLASLFTGLALMTKGLFVFVTICSGQIIYLIYIRKLNFAFIKKFISYILLSFVFALPEFICLYMQFDMHPEKVVFGKTGVSGLEWYFWGSQFGRFFNSGPIAMANKHRDYFFFVHTFLWSFLPWSLFFIFSIYSFIKNRIEIISYDFSKIIYLLAAFIPTFLMFSLTKFQLDYYINIIIPFAAIMCAYFLNYIIVPKWLLKVQSGINIVLLLIASLLVLLVFKLTLYSLYVFVPLIFLFVMVNSLRNGVNKENVIIFSAISISNVFVILMLIYRIIYPNFVVGLNLASYLKESNITAAKLYVVGDLNYNITNFYINNMELSFVNQTSDIKDTNYYILSNSNDKTVKDLNSAHELKEFADISINRFIPMLLSDKKEDINYYQLYKVN